MRLAPAEVAPLAPLLLPLTELGLFIVALGIIAMVTLFVKALLGGLSSVTSNIPFIGGVTSSAIHRAEQAVTNALGSAAGAISARIGAAEHELARVIDWIGREISRHAGLLKVMAEALLGTAATSVVTAALALLHIKAKAAQAEISSIVHRVVAAEQRLAHGIGADVLPHIRALDRTIDHTIEPDLAALKRRAKELEDGALDTFKWIRTHPLSIATGAFTGAVAIALARLGMTWARCENVGKVGRKLCGFPAKLLEDLLGLGLAFAVVIDPEATAEVALTTADAMDDVIKKILAA